MCCPSQQPKAVIQPWSPTNVANLHHTGHTIEPTPLAAMAEEPSPGPICRTSAMEHGPDSQRDNASSLRARSRE